MRIHFLTLVLAPLALAVAALTPQPALAASHVVQIPFNFVAAGEQCPAGSYVVHQDNRGDTVYLTGENHRFLWMLFPGDTGPREHRVVLTFDLAGQRYLLRSVQYDSMITARIDKKVKESIPAVQQVSVGGE